MSKSKANLGIKRLHSIEFVVHEAAPWADFFARGFGFQQVAASTDAAIEAGGTRRSLLRCADTLIVLAEPAHTGSPVLRYLQKHPEGVARINFLVADYAAIEQALVERNATLVNVPTSNKSCPEACQVCMATPLGDVEFAFVEAVDGSGVLLSGMKPSGPFDAAYNPAGLTGVDHLTVNGRTIMPIIAFWEHVMGFRRHWDVHFHTEDFRPGVGSGLKSVVMWDRTSGVKVANNEPLRPRFELSQVQLFLDANRGPGISQIAFGVRNILQAVGHGRQAGLHFMQVPPGYYESLPRRMAAQKIEAAADHSPDHLAAAGVLLDGDKTGYMLQAFCREQVVQLQRPAAGPLFLELVQRCGSQGFGEGNFRAIFEASDQPR